MSRIMPMASCIALLAIASGSGLAQVPPDPGQAGPYAVGQVTVTITNPNTGSQLATAIYYPSSGTSVDPSGAPYATLVFAPGFLASLVGTTSTYPGNGRHLASWGYIVAIPSFPSEDVEVRASDVQYLFSYLEAENANPGSRFFRQMDTSRLGMAGHSLGGVSTMMVAARDSRIKAGVALDPAYRPPFVGSGWDPNKDALHITVPLAVIGAPTQTCNADGVYNDIYPLVGSYHKAKLVIANGSHCDFMDTDNSLARAGCYLVCGGSFSQDRLRLVERYTAAWFNYYLRGEAEYYTYVYGSKADEDIQAGRMTRDVQTAPLGLSATGQPGAVTLNWTSSDYPVVAGYNIYRRQQSGSYPSVPYAQVGRVSSFVDADVVPGQRYFYVLRSRDTAGNEHQPSNEVSGVPGDTLTQTITPTLIPTVPETATSTPTSTATPTLTPTASGTGTRTPTATTTPILSPTATATSTPSVTTTATSTATTTRTSTRIPTSTATPKAGGLKHKEYMSLIAASGERL